MDTGLPTRDNEEFRCLHFSIVASDPSFLMCHCSIYPDLSQEDSLSSSSGTLAHDLC